MPVALRRLLPLAALGTFMLAAGQGAIPFDGESGIKRTAGLRFRARLGCLIRQFQRSSKVEIGRRKIAIGLYTSP